jgi:dTDP-4-amino-4,6-dideoxygalactose transaminase
MMQPLTASHADHRGERTKRLYLSPPHMSGKEQEFIRQAFDSNYIALLGPMVEAFEHELAEELEVPHVLSTASGTAAIHLALRCLDIRPGDEVWASTLTFIGSVAPIVYERARPVFIDANAETWTLDPDLLSEALASAAKTNGRLPKAIVPTDLYGQSCDLDAIVEISAKYGIPVICDSAEAMGTTYRGRKAGSGALMATYSFNGNKVITTSGGGALTSADEKLIQRARYLSTQAREPVVHYEHLEVGYNYRMSNILAAIGIAQLRVLADRVARRQQIFQHYVDGLGDLPGITFMPEASYGRHSRWLSVLIVDAAQFGADSEAIRQALEVQNIESRPVWKPMHRQPVFSGARTIGGAVADSLYAQGLCLPSGSGMTQSDQDRVIEVVRSLGALSLRRRPSMNEGRALNDHP